MSVDVCLEWDSFREGAGDELQLTSLPTLMLSVRGELSETNR
ncbi:MULTISPECIES: hypothetical protein [unclassified Schlesneria]